MSGSMNFGLPVFGLAGLTSAGTNQASALALSIQESVFTTVPPGTGCRLPSPAYYTLTVYNAGTNALLVYPAAGDQISGNAINASVSIAAGSSSVFSSFDNALTPSPRTWHQLIGGASAQAIAVTPGAGRLIVNGGGVAVPPTPPNGSILQLVGTQTTARLVVDGLAGSKPEIVFRRADGAIDVPTAVQSGEFLGGLKMTGHTGAAYAQPNRVEWIGYATENWTPDAQGSGIAFNVVTKGSTSQAAAFTVISNDVGTGMALFGSLALTGFADGHAVLQTHDPVMFGPISLGASAGPLVMAGAGPPPGGTVTISTLYVQSDGSKGAGLYFANAGGTYTAVAGV